MVQNDVNNNYALMTSRAFYKLKNIDADEGRFR